MVKNLKQYGGVNFNLDTLNNFIDLLNNVKNYVNFMWWPSDNNYTKKIYKENLRIFHADKLDKFKIEPVLAKEISQYFSSIDKSGDFMQKLCAIASQYKLFLNENQTDCIGEKKEICKVSVLKFIEFIEKIAEKERASPIPKWGFQMQTPKPDDTYKINIDKKWKENKDIIAEINDKIKKLGDTNILDIKTKDKYTMKTVHGLSLIFSIDF